MRIITAEKVRKRVADLAIKANLELRPDVLRLIKGSLKLENKKIARNALRFIIRNARIAKSKKIAICQDTGLPIVFVDLGNEIFVKGDMISAIQAGIRDGYKKAHLRQSVVLDPLRRKVRTGYNPAVVNIRIIKGNKLILSVLAKGFGCENKSAVKMFNPTASIEDISSWILEVVKAAGPDACPPFVLGIGIGGTLDEAAKLAKYALLEPINRKNKDKFLSNLENKILKKVNNTGIGPFGLGGKTTALAVKILTCPTHIAGLPVAINISCHALRSTKTKL
ncbi:MAG: fumarate hydratase [Candidatus Omnitrophota bacterium]